MTNNTYEDLFVQSVMAHNLSIAVAESCTGGLLAGQIINVSGVSAVFKAGFVTYTEEAKHNILGVKEETLLKYTAVSSLTAEEMVRGACEKANATVGIATTGYAGPGGGTDENPVGTVYIASYVKGEISVKKYQFYGERIEVRKKAVENALKQATQHIDLYFN